MRFLAFATDYDCTLAHGGIVEEPTLQALERLRASGRLLLMATGRELPELQAIFPRLDLFDLIVVENGAVLYRPSTREERLLAPEPPPEFVARLRAKGVTPLAVGRSIVATVEPHQKEALAAIQELGLELHVIFNKGSVMVLPSGVNKATGLTAALEELGLSRHNVVGIGDAENDHAFLSHCAVGVAVDNAVPALKDRADLVTRGARGAGVIELIDLLLSDDLADVAARLNRHAILLGKTSKGSDEFIDPLQTNYLVAGTSGSGKSTMATGVLERLQEAEYQYAIVDPEGDYTSLEGAVVLGDAQHPPVVQEIIDLLKKPNNKAVINMLGIRLEDRPAFFAGLVPHLLELRNRTGRPHLIVVDEAHHLLPSGKGPSPAPAMPATGMLYITVHPESVDPAILAPVGAVICVGQAPAKTLADFCKSAQHILPEVDARPLQVGEVLLWRPRTNAMPIRVQSEPPKSERRRHSRKYAEGSVGPERNFIFTGPEGKLNLRAQNLAVFLQMADGVDEATWKYHLKRGDCSTWFRNVIKDEELASEAADIEGQTKLPVAESKAAIRSAVERRYTLSPDKPSGDVGQL